MKGTNKLFGILSLLLLFGCKKVEEIRDDSEVRFRYFNLEANGWKSRTHTESIDNMDFSATEVPIQYYILKEMGASDLKKADSVYEENKRERIIEFTFKDKNKKDVLEESETGIDYKKGVEYMSSTIQKDFYAVTSRKDTIKCSGVLFERNFKVAPFTRIMLFFTGIAPEEKIQVVYDDHLFNKGVLKFKFADPILKL